jgi:hypothetical protein
MISPKQNSPPKLVDAKAAVEDVLVYSCCTFRNGNNVSSSSFFTWTQDVLDALASFFFLTRQRVQGRDNACGWRMMMKMPPACCVCGVDGDDIMLSILIGIQHSGIYE